MYAFEISFETTKLIKYFYIININAVQHKYYNQYYTRAMFI